MKKTELIAFVANLMMVMMILWFMYQVSIGAITVVEQIVTPNNNPRIALIVFVGKMFLGVCIVFLASITTTNLTKVLLREPNPKPRLVIKGTLIETAIDVCWLIKITPACILLFLKIPWTWLTIAGISLMGTAFIASPFAGCLSASCGTVGVGMMLRAIPSPSRVTPWILISILWLCTGIMMTAFITDIPEKGLHWFFLGF